MINEIFLFGNSRKHRNISIQVLGNDNFMLININRTCSATQNIPSTMDILYKLSEDAGRNCNAFMIHINYHLLFSIEFLGLKIKIVYWTTGFKKNIIQPSNIYFKLFHQTSCAKVMNSVTFQAFFWTKMKVN